MTDSKRNFWLTPNGLAALGLIGSVLYFLLTEHRAHFIYALPYMILLLCPAMHIFMHRNHNVHSDDAAPPSSDHRHTRERSDARR